MPLNDKRWLSVALAQADKIVGHTAENPAVGCVIIDKDDCLVGLGHTSQNGRPHAEVNALSMAGKRAQGGTAYVTLEPCSHHGKTGPCALALSQAGIAQVVIAQTDPDPRVSGKGIAYLESQNITVRVEPISRARRQMAGFLSRQEQGRPFVSVKMATSHDGYIAAKAGAQTWLTGSTSRAYVHDLRSRADVMMTTSGTIRADNPSLNVRIEGFSLPQPALAILDSEASLPIEAACLSAERQVILYHRAGAELKQWPNHLVPVCVGHDKDGLNLVEVFHDLHQRGLGRLMVEAGAQLFSSLDKHKLIDELIWLKAPHRLDKGILAWQPKGQGKKDKLDFSAPDNYITSYEMPLGADYATILYPNQR